MSATTATIQDVSDTALWVAYYRAEESERPQPLFRDPLAKVLLGERGARLANAMTDAMKESAKYTRLNVVVRTVIIDRFIDGLVRDEKATAVMNLGAGLDTRPYRLKLPSGLRWIEVDYPHMMALKNEKLKSEKPNVDLERVSMDLADREARQKLFDRVAKENQRVVVLTEGVMPYLSEAQVGELAEDLRSHSNFRWWITDYISPAIYKRLQTPQRMRAMKNAPFRFFPVDPEGFYRSHGWMRDRIQYLAEVGSELGRPQPMPWWFSIIKPLVPQARLEEFGRAAGYMVMTPS